MEKIAVKCNTEEESNKVQHKAFVDYGRTALKNKHRIPCIIGVKDESKAKGGIARAEKLSPEKRKEIAKKAAQARWSKSNSGIAILKSKYPGEIKIGDYKIPCAVLEDGTRILRERSVARALGKKGGAHIGKEKKQKTAPYFLSMYLQKN